jgi:putative ABC transport system ATP-binding protein
VVVFGVSGTGKTTLLNLLGALDRPDAGSIVVDGEEISALSEAGRTEFRRGKLGFVFQFYNLLPTLTARENVESAVEFLELSRKEIGTRAQEYLDRVGLGDKARKYPDQLSGGEQQRVAIARALAKQPRVLLADEPTGNLDEVTAGQITGLFREMNRSTGTTMVVVTHNPQFKQIAHKVFSITGHNITPRET